MTRPNLGSSVVDGWHSQYPKSFRKDPLRGWRSPPCKEALGDWFHAWHTSWDEDFLICGEDSCEAQVTNFVFHVNCWTGLSRQTCHIWDLRKATWEWQEGMLMQFAKILWGAVAQMLSRWMALSQMLRCLVVTIHWRMQYEWHLFGLIACP